MLNNRRFVLCALSGAAAAFALRTSAFAKSEQYTYDPLGRLAKVVHPDGRITTYAYDAAGNRSQVATEPSAPPPPPPPPPPLAAFVDKTSYEGGMHFDLDVVVTTTGGVAPYVYVWERTSGNTATSADSQSSHTTGWSYGGPWTGPTKVSAWRCKVSDATAAVVYTPTVAVQMFMS